MQLLPNDILLRKYKGEETLWVSQRLVMQVCGVSEEYFRQAARNRFKKSIKKGYQYGDFLPNTGKSWRWAKVKGRFYYDFDNLPDRKPTYYRSQLGTKASLLAAYNELVKQGENKIIESIKNNMKGAVSLLVDNTDVRFYMYDAQVGFTQQQAEQMATARAWCRYIIRQLAEDDFKKLGILKKQDFYQNCLEIIAPLELEGFKVKSAAYLRNKIETFPTNGTVNEQREFFISKKYGNINAQIVGKYPLFDEDTGEIKQFDIHQALMFHLYMNPGKPQKEYIRTLWEYYCEDIQQFKLTPVSYRAFCHHLSRFNNQIKEARARHGVDYYKKHVQTYVTTERLKYAHSLFAADGSGTINYKYYDKSEKLKTMKLYVILITDVASRFIAGWSASAKGQHKESSEMTQLAVKMAIEKGGNQTMYEIVSDNHSAFTSNESKSFLNLVFNKVRTIEVSNSQANPAETQFRLFKRSLKDVRNFLSTSWKTGIEGEANPDNINIHELPTYEEACLQMHDLITRWNNTALRDGVTPAERFENKHPNCQALEPTVLRYIYGNHTEVDISYMRGFVNVHKSHGYNESKMYQFEIPDYGGIGTDLIAKSVGYTTGAKLKVVWTDEMADLYTLDGQFILSCKPAQKAIQSHAEATDNHLNALGHNLKRKSSQTDYIDAFEEELAEVINGIGYSHSVALGGNKESYNGQKIANENKNYKKTAKQRVDRDFNDSEWQ